MIRQYLCLGEHMDSLISQGLTLMLYGMTTVVLFLVLLVVAMRLLAWFVSLTSSKPLSSPVTIPKADPDEATIAVISAAVQRYRDRA